MLKVLPLVATACSFLASTAVAFLPRYPQQMVAITNPLSSNPSLQTSTRHSDQQIQYNRRSNLDTKRLPYSQYIPLSMIFGKLFEESGPLGKGITVGKVQVALSIEDRNSPSSLFKLLARTTRNVGDSNQELSRMAHEVCIALLRSSDKWVGACSSSQWFSQNDSGKAESLFNEWVDREAMKFEKEYVPDVRSDDSKGGPTIAVVSIIAEIQGDTTEFKGAGYSLVGTKSVLSSLASSVLVDRGYCLNAVEVLWTPSEMDEVLTRRDVILDFPEIIDF